MPDPDAMCKCGHERKHHTEVLYGFECYGQLCADYNSKCECKGFEAAEVKHGK